jgi:NAD+ diphosphatase
MPDDFIASVNPPDPLPSQSYWFLFSEYRLLTRTAGDAATIPLAGNLDDLAVPASLPLYIGTFRSVPCFAAELKDADSLPPGLLLEDLRSLFGRLEGALYGTALAAIHLIEWDRNTQFCSKCRGPLRARTEMRAKECVECKRLEFPRLSPAIIVLIEKDDTLLLARSARFPAAFFSVLAGFVEPGESLEMAVHREVMEETGIAVKNIRYFGSQPWPYPDSLMLGFTAQYDSGEIKIDGEEIVEAGWYGVDNLPQLPGKVSIARQLIDSFIEKHS